MEREHLGIATDSREDNSTVCLTEIHHKSLKEFKLPQDEV
jgi:hypothetical protein